MGQRAKRDTRARSATARVSRFAVCFANPPVLQTRIELTVSSIFAAFLSLVYVPPREEASGRGTDSFPEQLLVIELRILFRIDPTVDRSSYQSQGCF